MDCMTKRSMSIEASPKLTTEKKGNRTNSTSFGVSHLCKSLLSQDTASSSEPLQSSFARMVMKFQREDPCKHNC
eukprot:1389059-Amphidinium_carterae.1